jgi:hypothetical protein
LSNELTILDEKEYLEELEKKDEEKKKTKCKDYAEQFKCNEVTDLPESGCKTYCDLQCKEVANYLLLQSASTEHHPWASVNFGIPSSPPAYPEYGDKFKKWDLQFRYLLDVYSSTVNIGMLIITGPPKALDIWDSHDGFNEAAFGEMMDRFGNVKEAAIILELGNWLERRNKSRPEYGYLSGKSVDLNFDEFAEFLCQIMSHFPIDLDFKSLFKKKCAKIIQLKKKCDKKNVDKINNQFPIFLKIYFVYSF